MKTITQIILFIFFVCPGIISCSKNSVEFESKEIDVTVSKNRLVIFNKIYKPIYHFVVERETAALINWAPISDDKNKISPVQSVEIYLNDVLGYQDGMQIIIYYWSVTNPETETIKSIVVDT